MAELFQAIEEEDVDKMRALLADPDVNVNYLEEFDQMTCFLMACEMGNMEIVQALLDDDRVNWYAISKYHGSALDMAVKKKNEALFKLLINHANIDIEKMGWNRMHADFALGDIETCKQYLKQVDEGIIDLNQQTNYSQLTPLHIACHMGHIEIVKLLINHPKIDTNLMDCYLYSPFGLACQNEHVELIKLFLTHKNFQEKNQDRIDFGNPEIATLCIENGKFDVNNVFRSACELDEIEIVEHFLENPPPGLDFHQANQNGNTPLHVAASIEIVSLLLECDLTIDINQRNVDGQTPLCLACLHGYFEIVDLLLDDPRIQVTDIKIEIWIAAQNGRDQVVKRILASNFDIDVNIRGNQHLDAYFTTQEFDHPEIRGLINEYEKNPAIIRAALRKELKLNVREPARLLSCVVLSSDNYLQIKQSEDQSFNQQIQFYRILLQLPLELQTRICNLTYDHNSFFINSKDFESALTKSIKAFIKLEYSNNE